MKLVDSAANALSAYVDRHYPIAKSRLGHATSRWLAHKRSHLAYYGAVSLINTTFLSVYVVASRSKASMDIFVGKSWVVRGRSVGKTWKITSNFPTMDHSALLYVRYG